jgi:hypothetical protein
MIDVKQFLRLKQKADDCRSQFDQAKGAFDQELKQMCSTFDVSTIEEAEILLAEKQKKQKKQIMKEKIFTNEIENLKKEFPKLFER